MSGNILDSEKRIVGKCKDKLELFILD